MGGAQAVLVHGLAARGFQGCPGVAEQVGMVGVRFGRGDNGAGPGGDSRSHGRGFEVEEVQGHNGLRLKEIRNTGRVWLGAVFARRPRFPTQNDERTREMAVNGAEFSLEFEILLQRVTRLEEIMTKHFELELELLPSQVAAMQEAKDRRMRRGDPAE